MASELCRLVLWRHNNELPLWRVVSYTPGQAIVLRDLPWLAATCNDILGLTMFEQFVYDLGEWTVETLADGQVAVLGGCPIILLRIQGVELCPLLGYELAAFDRYLGHHYDPSLVSEVDNRFDDSEAIRHIRVVAWTEIGEDPVVHRISFNDDNTIKLGRHYYLHKALGRRETANLWIPGGEWEGGVSVHRRFWVEGHYNSILIKLAEVGATIGLGRELIALEPVGKVRRGRRRVYVCLESYMALARSVNPAYDVIVPLGIQIRYDRARNALGVQHEEVDIQEETVHVESESIAVDTVEEDSEVTTVPCKRPADSDTEDKGQPPSHRIRLTSST